MTVAKAWNKEYNKSVGKKRTLLLLQSCTNFFWNHFLEVGNLASLIKLSTSFVQFVLKQAVSLTAQTPESPALFTYKDFCSA